MELQTSFWNSVTQSDYYQRVTRLSEAEIASNPLVWFSTFGSVVRKGEEVMQQEWKRQELQRIENKLRDSQREQCQELRKAL